MTHEELLKEPEYPITKCQIDLFRLVIDYMVDTGLSIEELSEKTKVTKNSIRALLKGDDICWNINQMCYFANQLGYQMTIKFEKV